MKTKAFLALLKVSFLGMLVSMSGRSRGRNSQKSMNGIGVVALFVVVMVFISGTYSFTMAAALAPVGGMDVMLAAMTLVGILFPMFMTLYGAQGVVFSAKDMDLIFSLPVSSFQVMLARILALYLENLILVEAFLIPAGIAWLVFGGGGGAVFIILLIVQGAFLAFLPTLLALIIGFVVGQIASRSRFKNLANIIVSLLFAVLIMVIVLLFNQAIPAVEANIEGARQALFTALPPLGWMLKAVTGPNLLYLLLVVALCIVPFLAIAWLFSLGYKGLITRLSGTHIRSDYKLRAVGASSSFAALWKKEARKFFGTPTYFLNAGLMAPIAIIGSIVAVFYRGAIQSYFDILPADIGGDVVHTILTPILLGVMLFLLMCTIPSSVSISLEGKTLWILTESPVSTGRIFAAKAGFGTVLNGVVSLVAVPLLGFALGLPVVDVICILLICLFFSAFVGMCGLQVNLMFPRLDAENETIVIKQSASVMLSLLFAFLAAVVLVGLYLLLVLAARWDFAVYALAAIVLLAVLDIILGWSLNTKGRRQFAQLAG